MKSNDHRHFGYNTSNLDKARKLRRELTRQEKHLWYDFLKGYPVHFYRQRPIAQYVVDFCSVRAQLVVELDGDQHGEPEAMEYDERRTRALRDYGFRVVRFANGDVEHSFENVCYAIHDEAKAQLRKLGDLEALTELEELEKAWDR